MVDTYVSILTIIIDKMLLKLKDGLVLLEHIINTNLISVKVYKDSAVTHTRVLDKSTIGVVSKNSIDKTSSLKQELSPLIILQRA